MQSAEWNGQRIGDQNAQAGNTVAGTGKKGRGSDLSDRCVELAVRVIRVAGALPGDDAGIVIRRQMLRAGTSVGANYEEARGAESRADFLHKMQIVLKELRELRYWLRVIAAAELLPEARLSGVLAETEELISILVKSLKTARGNAHVR